MYLKTLESLKESAIKEQIVVGRKFIGVSFKSQPKIVHFKVKFFYSYYAYKNSKNILKNFRILMYTINTCKFIDLTEKLKDFISIE